MKLASETVSEDEAWIRFAAARATVMRQNQNYVIPAHEIARFADEMIEEMRKRSNYA